MNLLERISPVTRSSIIVFVLFATESLAQSGPNEPFCFVDMRNGTTIDLTQMCRDVSNDEIAPQSLTDNTNEELPDQEFSNQESQSNMDPQVSVEERLASASKTLDEIGDSIDERRTQAEAAGQDPMNVDLTAAEQAAWEQAMDEYQRALIEVTWLEEQGRGETTQSLEEVLQEYELQRAQDPPGMR